MPLQSGSAEQAPAAGVPDSPDVTGLIGRTSAALSSHCLAAHQELQQTQQLLNDATRKLLNCFHAATRNLSTHDSGSGAPAAAQAEANLLAASQHLQFSDLVGQMLATTEQRVDSLLRVLQTLQSLVQSVNVLRAESKLQTAELDAGKRAFIEALCALEALGDSGIRQVNMEAGDAELF